MNLCDETSPEDKRLWRRAASHKLIIKDFACILNLKLEIVGTPCLEEGLWGLIHCCARSAVEVQGLGGCFMLCCYRLNV